MRRLLLLALPAVLAGLLALAAPVRLVAQQITYGPVVGGAGGMSSSASNAVAGSTKDNLGLVRDLVKDFGAVCDGTTDDAAAFAAATAWLAAGPQQRQVTLPAKTCATSSTVTLGDGRQHSTKLSVGLTGSETTITVDSIAGIQAGDSISIRRDAGTLFKTTVSGAPSGNTVTLAGAYSGGTAAIGNNVYTGKVSSYNGGGFVGYGSNVTNSEWPTPGAVSTIKYIGAAASSTTLTATAVVGATSLTVASIATMNIGDLIGITMDGGGVWWTPIVETPTGSTVVIGDPVPVQATSGNAVSLGNVPVVKVAGPIYGAVLEGVYLNANSLASVGLEAVHIYGGKLEGVGGVRTSGYTAAGFYLHPLAAYIGVAVGATRTDYELYATQPDNTNTIGLFLGGSTVCFCQNRFKGAWSGGGATVYAAAIREDLSDNNTFTRVTTSKGSSGAGLYRQPQAGVSSFPQENTFIASSLVGNVTEGTASGGTLGNDVFLAYMLSDGETTPTAATSIGITSTGTAFNVSGIVPATWTSYSPTVACAVGTLTTASAVGRYMRVPGTKLVFFEAAATITNHGSCATAVTLTLPLTAANIQKQYVPGRDFATGSAVTGLVSPGSSVVSMITYNNGCPCADGGNPGVTGFYEIP